MMTSDLINELPATPVRVDGTTAVEMNGVYWRRPGVVVSSTLDTIMVVQMPYSYEHMIRVMTMVDPQASGRKWGLGENTECLPNQSGIMGYFGWFDGWDNDQRRYMVLLGLHGFVERYLSSPCTRRTFSSASRRAIYSNAFQGAYLAYRLRWGSSLTYEIVRDFEIPAAWRAALPYPLSNHLLGNTYAHVSVGFPTGYESLLDDFGGSGDLQFGQFLCNPDGLPVMEIDHYNGWSWTSGGYVYYPAVAHGARVVHVEMVSRDEWPIAP